jgi:hypothetical protein
VELFVNPKGTEVFAGSKPIILSVRASGTGLTFRWELYGPGRLEEKERAAFYFPPMTLDKRLK